MIIHHYEHWRDVPAGLWTWGSFTPAEMSCKRTGSLTFSIVFMSRLQRLRSALNFPLSVTSGYRSESYDIEIGGAGVHPTGRAADITIYGARALALLDLVTPYGFTGVGTMQHSRPLSVRFIHLDDLNDDETRGPRPWIWSYG